MKLNKTKVLIFCDWYYPGYKAGGPIQSCRNLIDLLSDQVEFYVFTSDRDLGETAPYNSIDVNKWIPGDKNEKVYYAPASNVTFSKVKSILDEVSPHVVYFNSMFSFRFTLMPLMRFLLSGFKGNIVVAPRGMLHNGAISMKRRKKELLLSLLTSIRLQKRIKFHATNEQEAKDISSYFSGATSDIVSNVPHINRNPVIPKQKNRSELNLVFISRLHLTKNLLFLLEILRDVSALSKVTIDIYGEEEDVEYSRLCKTAAAALPDNIKARFHGPVPNHKVFATLSRYHAFVLPTRGENFGHAIFEALTCGLPVIISDQTPWRSLTSHFAGWDIPLTEKTKYLSVINELLSMDQETYEKWQHGARQYSDQAFSQTSLKEQYLRLFHEK